MFKWLTKSVFGIGLTPADPLLSRFMAGGGAGNTPSGKAVTVDTALQLAAVWACAGLISQTIASLPATLYGQDADGSRTVAVNHPLYTLLHDQPNSDMTAVEFWESMLACVLLWGNAYARKDTNGLGDVIALTPMAPDKMSVRRLPDGTLLYTYTPYNARAEDFPEDQIFHIKGWSLNGLLGLSPIGYARSSMGTAMAADEAAGKFFANGLSLSGFVETGGTVLTQAQRDQFKAELATIRGSGNSGKTMLLEGPFKYNPLSMSPDDAQLLASREFSVDEICRWFRVPAWMIGHMAKSTSWGTGLEQQMIGFLTFTLRPWLTRIEQRVKMQLVKPGDRGKIFMEFNVEGLLRADSAGRAALYAVEAQNGLATRDELRRRENRPKVAGGDRPTVQSNLVFLDDLGKQPAAQTPDGFGHPAPPQATNTQPPVRQ